MDYTAGVYQVHSLAIREASRLGHPFVEEEHELLGICGLGAGLGKESAAKDDQRSIEIEAEARALKSLFDHLGVEPSRLREAVIRCMEYPGNRPPHGGVYHRSERCKEAFARAGEMVGEGAAANVLHLMAAILEDPGPVVSRALQETGLDKVTAFREVAGFLRSGREELGGVYRTAGSTEYIDRYGRDLVKEAAEAGPVRIVGRREELLQLERALLNVKKNPVLVGEEGVGKDTLVKALASRIAHREVPSELRRLRIVKIAVNDLLKGEEIRPGRLLERLMRMIVEARESRRVIFYLDDVNLLMGGELAINRDIANVLLPAVLNNEIRCILTADNAGYTKHLAGNPRLSGRFTRIDVPEPSEEVTLQILSQVREDLEREYPVRISDDALQAAVRLSYQYDAKVCLPEKAIDLLHEACAMARLPTLTVKHKVDTIFTTRWDMYYREPQARDLVVDGRTVRDVVANRTGLPPEVVSRQACMDDRPMLDDLEEFLKERIVGQDRAIEIVCSRIITSYAGLSERKGPLAVFLFLGPTGVGKTETARLIAERLFGSQDYLLRIDMSEYMEPHSVARLIGSPPGYVGYEEEGALTGWLRGRPHSVILLDEIEKAHPKVFDLFLQVFDSGRITDAKGKTSDARRTIIIMTSNLLPEAGGGEGSLTGEEEIRQELERNFRREFLNRVDRVVVFRPLGLEDVKRMVRPILEGLARNLQEKYSLAMEVDEEALEYLARAGYDQRYGARELRRTVEKLLEEPLSRKLLSGELGSCRGCRLAVRGEELAILPVT